MLEANTLIRSDRMHERGRTPFPLTGAPRSFQTPAVVESEKLS